MGKEEKLAKSHKIKNRELFLNHHLYTVDYDLVCTKKYRYIYIIKTVCLAETGSPLNHQGNS